MGKSKILFVVAILCSLFLITGEAVAGEPELLGQAAVLLDLNTGQFLYEKNPDQLMYPASTTKILTALVAVQKGNLNDRVTMSEEAVYTGGSAIWSSPGERFTLESLLWAILLNSGNDAATAVAEHVGGSVENFAELMNAEARRLGARGSHFTNPHGLHDANHYTTARDLALIGRAALKQPQIREMVGTQTHQLERDDPEALSLLLNHNKLLSRYEGAFGVKTGYTSEAGQCLIAAAERDGRALLSVVLKSDGDQIWADSTALLDYGFNSFQEAKLVAEGEQVGVVPVVNGNGEAVLLTGAGLTTIRQTGDPGSVRWEVRLDRELMAPMQRGESAGVLVVKDAGKEVGQVKLLVGQDVDRLPGTTWWYRTGLIIGGLVVLVGGLRLINRWRRRRRVYLFRK